MGSVIRFEHIVKRYGSVTANDDISFEIGEGEVHSVVGENGAGKSTLMNVLYGMTSPDSGKLFYKGEAVDIRSPHDAIRLGIGMVHQHFMLVPSLTVMENVVLGLPPQNEKIWRPEKFRPAITELMDGFGLSVPLNAKVGDLSVGTKQRVEILKILYRRAQVIILDEPTAILTPQETQELFATIRLLKEKGHTIIFISHKLREVMEISDRITTLRDGHYVKTVDKAGVTAKDIAIMMIGRDLETIDKPKNKFSGTNLRVENLSAEDEENVGIEDVTFSVQKGEILGVAGVEGNGQDALVDAIVGAKKASHGRIWLMDEDITGLTIKERMDRGMAHIPQDRISQGLAIPLSIEKNLVLGIHDREPIKKHGLISWKQADRAAEDLILKYSIKSKNKKEAVGNLSGGNMQKVVVAREFARGPSFIVACQPTRGVDIGSSRYIRECLLEIKKKGGSVLLVSADLDEILELSDRILVLYDGKISGVLDASQATEERLGELMFGHTEREIDHG